MPIGTTYPAVKRSEAKELRQRGLSLGEISIKMAIRKNTVQGWEKNVKLTPKQKKRIKFKEIISAARGRRLAYKVNKEKVEERRASIRDKVSGYGPLPFEDKNIGKIVLGILYICEGSKYPATRYLKFGNSDPGMIKLFLKLLRDNFTIDESKFRCRVQHREDQDPDELTAFWSEVTAIPLDKFYRAYSDKRTKDKPTKKTEYKGICAVNYLDANLQLEWQAIGEAVIRNGGAGGIRTLDLNTASVARFLYATAPLLAGANYNI